MSKSNDPADHIVREIEKMYLQLHGLRCGLFSYEPDENIRRARIARLEADIEAKWAEVRRVRFKSMWSELAS